MQSKRIIHTVLASVFLLVASIATADKNNIEGEFIVGGALTGGGDTLAEVEVVRFYNNVDTEKLKGGGTFYAYGGYIWPLSRSEDTVTRLQVTMGFHFDAVTAADDSVSFERYPIDVMLYQYPGDWRIGFGVTHHLSPTIDLIEAGGGEIDFDNATGAMIELGRKLGHINQYISLRYTGIEYETEGADFDGSNIGVNYSFQF